MSDYFDAAPAGTWPAGHRAAISLCVLVDGNGGDDPGIDYTATGIDRLAALFADLDLTAAFAWSERALNSFPPAIRRIGDLGHEIAGLHTSTDGLDPESLRAALGRVSASAVVGSYAIEAPADLGAMQWQITGAGGDIPSMSASPVDGTPIVTLPVSPYWVDRTWLDPRRPHPPSSMLEAWSLSLAEIRTLGGLMTVLLHPHIIARPGFAGTLTRFLDEIVASGDVWIARPGLIAEWWAGQAPSS